MHRRRLVSGQDCLLAATAIALGLACPMAHAQWIDAGGQANLMHQQELLRNQTTGEGPDWAGEDKPPEGSDQDLRKRREQRRLELQPEYARRLRAQGKTHADAWLARAMQELARRDRDGLRARNGH